MQVPAYAPVELGVQDSAYSGVVEAGVKNMDMDMDDISSEESSCLRSMASGGWCVLSLTLQMSVWWHSWRDVQRGFVLYSPCLRTLANSYAKPDRKILI